MKIKQIDKMKKYILFAILTMVNMNLCQGQYVPFDTENTKWVMSEIFPVIGPGDVHRYWEIYTTGDTLINSRAYTILALRNLCRSSPDQQGAPQYAYSADDEVHKIGALREDAMKVYFYKFNNPEHFSLFQSGIYNLEANSEYLLYDFTKEIGDTINYPPIEWYEVINNDSILHSIPRYSVVQNIIYRDGVRTLQVNNSTSYIFQEINEIKEGVGSSRGVLGPFYSHLTYLECYIPDYPLEQECSVCENILSATTINKKTHFANLYPNPNKGTFYLSSDFTIESLEILDSWGRSVINYDSIASKTVHTSTDLPQGVYFAKYQVGKEFKTIKFVVY